MDDAQLYDTLSQAIGHEQVDALAGAIDTYREQGMNAQQIVGAMVKTGQYDGTNIDLTAFGAGAQTFTSNMNADEFTSQLEMQANEGYDPAQDYEATVEPGRLRKVAQAAAGIGAILLAAGVVQNVGADPVMYVDQDYSLGGNNFSGDYLIQNTTPGSSQLDALDQFYFPAGSINGINATDFTFLDNTSGNDIFNVNVFDNYSIIDLLVQPQNELIFHLGVDGTVENPISVTTGLADGMSHDAYGVSGDWDFNEQSVPVPYQIPEPSSLALVALGLAGLLKARNKMMI